MDTTNEEKPVAEAASGPVAKRERRRRQVLTASITLSPLTGAMPGVSKKKVKRVPKGIGSRICIYQGVGGANRAFAGLRALAAAIARGDEKVEVFDFGPMTEDEARELVLWTVLNGEKGCPFKIAEQLPKFVEAHPELKSTRDLGARFGCTHTTVERYLSLRRLPADVFKAGLGGKIRPTHAYLMAKVKDERTLHQIARYLLEGDKAAKKEAASELRDLTRARKPCVGYPAWQRIRNELLKAWHTCASEDRPKVLAELRDLLTSFDPGGATGAGEVA